MQLASSLADRTIEIHKLSHQERIALLDLYDADEQAGQTEASKAALCEIRRLIDELNALG